MNKLQQFGQTTIQRLKAKFKEKGKVATGKTINSLSVETNENNITFFGADWIEFVEFGRGATKNQSTSKGQFYASLKEWAKAKNIREPKLRYIYWKITKFGTKLFRENKNAGVLTEIFNKDFLQSLENQFIFAKIESINSDIDRILNKKL